MDAAVVAFLVVGLLFIGMALSATTLKRLPLTASLLYLLVGIALGPHGVGFLDLDPIHDSRFLELITEIAVIVSLFTAGLKLRIDLRDGRWWLPIRLAFGSMAITVGLIAVVGVVGIGLPLGAAVLLGAVLAPTDPVLASDVQVSAPEDQDRVRFGLTGEAGLNDGTAFPFVMLGLGLLGVHELGPFGARWFAIDLIWAVVAGLAVGALFGSVIGGLVLYLRRHYREAVGLDDFLTLGLIALSYGAALMIHSYGFLAVFAAGLALRRIEQQQSNANPNLQSSIQPHSADARRVLATHPDTAPTYMARAMLGFNEQLERIGEVFVVVLVGTLLAWSEIPNATIWFIPVLLFIIRPIAAWIGVYRTGTSEVERRMITWFGIRGIGSVYYLSFAIVHGVPEDIGRQLAGITLATIAVSVTVHGISVTPLMDWYAKRSPRE